MGDRVFGPYRLLSRLGQGGMGEVWRALDTRKDRRVALKILGSWVGDDPDYARRFRREAALAARLNAPNIVPIHDYGEIDGHLFIDMPLVAGTDLEQLIDREGPLLPARAVGIVDQVADALDVAHRAGLVHRDVKPSNTLVTHPRADRDFVYLIDFGITRALGSTSISQTGSVIGTPAYMAPERFEGDGDHRGDVYALACMLYTALTGRPPFEPPEKHLVGYVYAHLHAPPPCPSRDNPAVPDAFDAVVARGMAKQPDDRYSSAGELATAARAALLAAGGPRDAVVSSAAAAPPRDTASPRDAEAGRGARAPRDPVTPHTTSAPRAAEGGHGASAHGAAKVGRSAPAPRAAEGSRGVPPPRVAEAGRGTSAPRPAEVARGSPPPSTATRAARPQPASGPTVERRPEPAAQPGPPTTATPHRRRSVLALGMGAILGVVVLLLGIADHLRSGSPDPVTAGPALASTPGVCATWARTDATDLVVVDCAQPHLFEQMGQATLPDQPDPPADPQWRDLVAAHCDPLASTYLGGPLDPYGRYRVGALRPTTAQWAAGYRTLHCGLELSSRSGALYLSTGKARDRGQSAVERPGTCLQIDARTIGDATSCVGVHAVEVFGIVDLAQRFTGTFPSVADQDDYLRSACSKAAGEYAGKQIKAALKLTIYWDNLSEASWNARSRKVNCNFGALLPDRSGFAPVLGTVRGGDVTVGTTPAQPDLRQPGVPVLTTPAR